MALPEFIAHGVLRRIAPPVPWQPIETAPKRVIMLSVKTLRTALRRSVNWIRWRMARWPLAAALKLSTAKGTGKRHEDKFSFLDRIVKSFGFELYASHPFWSRDPEFRAAAEGLKAVGIEMRARKFMLYLMAKAVRNLSGDTVECGSFKGEGSFLVCLGTGLRPGYVHHIFDSFEGLSAPTVEDFEPRSGTTVWRKYDLAEPISRVKDRLVQFPWVQYHPGWIPSEFHTVADRRFALVHIDVDIHDPTRDALAFFYERTLPGGIILCDDYAFVDGSGATKACDDFFRDKPESSMIYLGTGQGFVVKR